MELHEAAAALADGSFSLVHDAARRNLVFARSADDSVHAIVCEAVDEPTALWIVECLRAGAAGAAEALAAEDPTPVDDVAGPGRSAAIAGQRRDKPAKTTRARRAR